MKDKDLIRILVTPILVVVGILAVLIIFSRTMRSMQQEFDPEAMKEISGVAGTAIAMIGTLVGFIAGHTAGSAGKEKADDRAMDAMNDKMNAMVEKEAAMQQKEVAEQQKAWQKDRVEFLWGMAPPEMKEKARNERPDLFS